MTTRTSRALGAIVLCAAAFAVLLAAPAAAGAKTATAQLRVLTPTKVLDPGTTYIVGTEERHRPTRDADCFGAPGGSGAEYTYQTPTALSLLAAGADGPRRSCARSSLTDQFGFGLGICGIGGVDGQDGQSFWYLKSNHQELAVGADQAEGRARATRCCSTSRPTTSRARTRPSSS